MRRPPQCRDCGKAMDPGYLLDHTHGGYTQATWIEGLPEKGRIFRMLKIRGRRNLQALAYRCPRCGRLEMYALE